MRAGFLILYFLTLSVGLVIAQAPVPEATPERIGARTENGFTYPYYIYVPSELKTDEAKKQRQTILVIPNNSPKLSDDFAFHEADVQKRMAMASAVASVLKVVVLMPVFPRPESDWRIYTLALDRDSMVTEKKELRRFDLQLIAMIDDARSTLKQRGLTVDRRVLLNGFSAQAMFVNRFTFLHPDRVKAAAIGSPGGWPIAPVAKFQDKDLRYPIGIADFREVSGEKIDLKQLRKVPLLIFIGDKDENDSVPFGDSYDDEDREIIMPLFGKTPVERWAVSQRLYRDAGMNAEFRLYPGVAHTVTPQMRDDIRAFLLKYR